MVQTELYFYSSTPIISEQCGCDNITTIATTSHERNSIIIWGNFVFLIYYH